MMPLSWDQAAQRLDQAAALLDTMDPIPAAGPLYAGIDLGTADIVLMVLDAAGEPVAVFLEWAEVVRDGVVVDYVGAIDIVRRLLAKAERRLGVRLASASTSYPPGTDPRLSIHILEACGLDLVSALDEPTCVAKLFDLDNAAVADIGGGTTGTAVVRRGKVVFSGDEPSGGRHITLAIAGHFRISIEEAERRKLSGGYGILDLARPTLQRISDIVAKHIRGHAVERIVLTGGTCSLPGIEEVFAHELKLPIQLPRHPLFLTPLAIAAQPLFRRTDS
jgi:ethanolamine utilization protein EutJ